MPTGTPAMARNQLMRATTASLKACEVVPGTFAATSPVQLIGTDAVGAKIEFHLSRIFARLEVTYQSGVVCGNACSARGATPDRCLLKEGGAASGSPISGTC